MPELVLTKEVPYWAAKFIRIEQRIVTTEPTNLLTNHDVLAAVEGITQLIERLRNENPVEVDAGRFSIGRAGALFCDRSGTLHLPVLSHAKEARLRTTQIFTEQYPNIPIFTNSREYDALLFKRR